MGSKFTIRALDRGIAVLQAVNRAGSMNITEIAKAAGIPHPTAIRIVRTLAGQGLIAREPHRQNYRPTALVQTLSCGFQNHDRLVQTARRPIVALTKKVGWPISVLTRAGPSMITRDTTVALTSLTFNVYESGIAVPIFGSASGQVYFAFSSVYAQREMLAQAATANAITLKAFRSGKKTSEIIRQGYATMAAMDHPAARANGAIAVPILVNDEAIGALALVFFSSALTVHEAAKRFASDLSATAAEIGTRMEKGA